MLHSESGIYINNIANVWPAQQVHFYWHSHIATYVTLSAKMSIVYTFDFAHSNVIELYTDLTFSGIIEKR